MNNGVLNEDVLKFLYPIINGDSNYNTEYLQGYKLVELFNKYGFQDKYERGFPSRWVYTFSKLKELNDKSNNFKIFSFIEDFVHPRKYVNNQENLERMILDLNNLICFDGYIVRKNSFGYYKFHKIGEAQASSNSKAVFEDIENSIIKTIKQAKDSILIAVSWISNKKIIQELNKKYSEGLQISLIVNDDDKNKNNKGIIFPYYLLKIEGVYSNLMHHKFAIFDNNIVISGSYNWTTSAEYNEENILIIEDLIEVESFKNEYKKLLKLYRQKTS